MTQWTLGIALVIILLNSTIYIKTGFSRPKEVLPGDLQRILETTRTRSKYPIPALGGAILKNGQLTAAMSGYRKSGDPTPAQVTDPFHLASCTKAMTATLVAIFIERGKLNYSTTLGEIFPNLRMNSQAKRITIGNLLTHLSGITSDEDTYDQGSLWERMEDPHLNAREGRWMVTKKILEDYLAPPVLKFEYSNWNYMILGAVLEKISNVEWETLMRKEIFTPLKMDSCGFGDFGNEAALHPDAPLNHVSDINDSVPRPIPAGYKDLPETVGPAGTVHCNMMDWAKFLQMQLDGLSGKDTLLLDRQTFSKMKEAPNSAEPNQWSYTYGAWGKSPDGTQFNHAGSDPGNAVDAWLLPNQNLAVMSVTNWGDPIAEKATYDITQAFMAFY